MPDTYDPYQMNFWRMEGGISFMLVLAALILRKKLEYLSQEGKKYVYIYLL